MSASETLHFESPRVLQGLYNNNVQNLKVLEERFGVVITTREGWVKLEGPPKGVGLVKEVFEQLQKAQAQGMPIRQHEFRQALDAAGEDHKPKLADLYASRIQISARKPMVAPKTTHQRDYLEAIQKHDLVMGLGPAGTGKTFLAMAMALFYLKSERVARVVLTRPAVEAGEALGFLPGDLEEKIFPYLRPLYDALHEMLDPEETQRYMEKGMIEIAPLAYMRGRTLSQSFVILDEAQNTTTEQMFMFLTRLGPNSKCVVTGDPTQVDLPQQRKSGLIEAIQALKDAPGIASCWFEEKDVVRHELVQTILSAYKAHRGQKATSLTL